MIQAGRIEACRKLLSLVFHADMLKIGCHDEACFSVLQMVSGPERTHLCGHWRSRAQGQSWVSYMRETHAMRVPLHAKAESLKKACRV